MIPTDLKPGAILRCIEPRGSALPADKLYVLVRYKRFDSSRVVVLEQGSNDISSGGAGWYLRRFELACNAGGSDYQADDDVDLLVPPTPIRELYGRQDRLTATEHWRREQEAKRLYANMTTRIERA